MGEGGVVACAEKQVGGRIGQQAQPISRAGVFDEGVDAGAAEAEEAGGVSSIVTDVIEV